MDGLDISFEALVQKSTSSLCFSSEQQKSSPCAQPRSDEDVPCVEEIFSHEWLGNEDVVAGPQEVVNLVPVERNDGMMDLTFVNEFTPTGLREAKLTQREFSREFSSTSPKATPKLPRAASAAREFTPRFPSDTSPKWEVAPGTPLATPRVREFTPRSLAGELLQREYNIIIEESNDGNVTNIMVTI